MIRLERRLTQPRWLAVAVPLGSLAVAFGVMTLVLLATGHAPGHTFSRLFDTGFGSKPALNESLVSATPLLFTGLCAAVAFRMQLFNIGGEGQLYAGAILGAAAGIALGNHNGWVSVPAMVAAGAIGGAALALVPAILRAFFSTNEIITSLMLNYVGALVVNYLIFDSESYWRDTSSPTAKVFPQGKNLPDAASWPVAHSAGLYVPFGLLVGVVLAAGIWLLYTRTRFGFEVQVIGDSPRAATYAGMRTRRKILAVMALSGAIAGIGGASQDGDFRHTLDPRGLTAAGYGYAGIVIAALARYNPFAVCLIAFLLGGLQNAGFALQGADFPSGLVGVMQGVILFCVLGGEMLMRYRIRFSRAAPRIGGDGVSLLAAGGINDSILVVVLASAVAYGTPLLYAALGELLAERSGVLNLGVEGMMLVGAVMGFWAVQRTGSLLVAIVVAAIAGGGMALIHGFLVVTLRANQIVSGLALTIFAGAAGLSSYLGNDLNVAGQPAKHSFGPFLPHSWQNAKVIGPILLAHSELVFASWVCVVLVAVYLGRTRLGLNLRAVGESPAAADAMGINVSAYRYAHTIVGGAFAGVGGATFTLSITPQWVDGITGGAGWIAIALVIFAFWRPALCLVGAYFFGAFSGIPFTFQARGILSGVPPELFQSLPYVMTVVVLVLVSSAGARRRLGAPAALGTPYVREER